ncbi:creatininase family protein, partial [Candidatus Altiarchaeota archaeon]
MKLREKTWSEVTGMNETFVVVPIGSIEQHGPHLPLETDTLIAEAVAGKIAEEIDAVVAPTITPGLSPEHLDFPGTLSLKEETFVALIEDYVSSLAKHNFEKIILVN